ncbi:MAG: porin [Hyphomonadaceae bacterium]|nr:porin [Hyphomonadaceae bacterium]
MIKKLSALSVIALAFAATPALAQTGHVGLSYSSDDDVDTDVWAVEGASAFAFSDHIGAQVDGNIGSYDFGGDSELGWRFNGHLFFGSDAWRVGGLFGTSTIDVGGIKPKATHWGVEGQYNFGQFVLGASAIWGDADGIVSPSLDYDNVDLNGDFYVTDNFVIGASYGFGSVDNGFSSEDTTNYSIDAEYQFGSAPFSVQASWQHWEFNDISAIQSDGFTIGGRWNFGGTLRERDSAGFRNSAPSVLEHFFGLQ